MEGQIEGLSIAGRSCGLWNFKNSFKVMAARGRDRLREKNEESWSKIENNKTDQNNISREIRTNHRGNKKWRGEVGIK